MKCERCKSDKGTEELHSYPYASEINDNNEPSCNCCSECEYECCMDI